ncbi:MAG: hypothetical protein HON04_17440 [Planctomicrobium sp.]|jgi:anti-sigma factor RsiW|nr:hypothetical protein [Planctomicrobium sp.]
MEKLSRLSTEDRENLSAYLDGELDDGGTQRIETLLVQSSVARNDVELLSKTYDLLDELPRPDAPKDFLEKTLATAKMEQVKHPISEQQWFITTQKMLILSGWTVALVVASAIGFMVTNQYVERPDDALIQELPLIQNLDRYEEVQSVEFLDLLTADEKLMEEMRKATSYEQK